MDDSFSKYADLAKSKMGAMEPKGPPDDVENSTQPDKGGKMTPEQEALLAKVKEEIAKSPEFKAAIKAC
jgi:hypothetical protein